MEYFVAQLCQQSIVTSMHPRTSILINITELHNDGCLSACTVNATTLALLDAGIPLRYIVSAASCCISDEGTIYVNPSKETIKTSASYVTIAVESETSHVLLIDSSGTLNSDQLAKCIALLKNKCQELFKCFRACISEKYSLL